MNWRRLPKPQGGVVRSYDELDLPSGAILTFKMKNIPALRAVKARKA
jgi:hypothetical protein